MFCPSFTENFKTSKLIVLMHIFRSQELAIGEFLKFKALGVISSKSIISSLEEKRGKTSASLSTWELCWSASTCLEGQEWKAAPLDLPI